jgi:hypothetical protein
MNTGVDIFKELCFTGKDRNEEATDGKEEMKSNRWSGCFLFLKKNRRKGERSVREEKGKEYKTATGAAGAGGSCL